MLSITLTACFLALGALLTWLARSPGHARLLRRLEAPAALAVAGLCYVWFDHSLAPADRSGEPFMLVANCQLFGLCFTAGTGSSVVLDNGAVWPDLLFTVRHFGGSMSDVRVAVLAMACAGVALVFLLTARFARPALAVPAAVTALALMSFLRFGTPLLDCSITLLFAAASVAALLVYSLSGRRAALVTAALFASHALNAHPSAVVLLPALLFVAALEGRRAFPTAGLALAVFTAAAWVTSSQAVAGNWGALNGRGLLPLVFGGAVLIVGAGAALHDRHQRLPAAARGAVVALVTVAPYAGGVLVLLAIHHELHARYLPPVVAPVSVAAVMLVAWVVRGAWAGRTWEPLAFALTFALGYMALSAGPSPNTPPRAPQLARTDAIELPPMEARQLTPEGQDGLRRLAGRVRAGALGGAIEGVGFHASFQSYSDGGAIRLDVARRDRSAAGYTLMRPPTATATGARHFVLYPDDGIAPDESRRLAALLDEVFPASPWAGDPRDFAPRLHTPGAMGNPVSVARIWWSVAFLLATTLAGLGYLLIAARPRTEAESLLPASKTG